jgi:putative ATP-dependent endonuclease of OLD family
MMMANYSEAYRVEGDELAEPDEDTIKAVLGKRHDVLGNQYTEEQQTYFDAYHRRFKLGSKPTWHIRAMASMDGQDLIDNMPQVVGRMLDRIESDLEDWPE